MATAYNPGIVTSGLLFCFDIGNARSYPGSGSTTYDIGSSGNNGTLYNTPAYSSSNGGYLTLNGTNNYIDFGTAANLKNTTCSFEAWFNPNAVTGYGDGAVLLNITDGTNWRNGAGLSVYNGLLYGGVANGTTNYSATYAISTGSWIQAVMTFNSSSGAINTYTNGTLRSTTTGASCVFNATNKLWSGWGGPGYTSYLSTKIACGRVYSSALTASEVLQNYNALRGRFGL